MGRKGHGPLMFLVCRKLTSDAVPEYVRDLRFSAPSALDASAITLFASCAAALAASTPAIRAVPVSFRIMRSSGSHGELSQELRVVLPDGFLFSQLCLFGLNDAVHVCSS